MDTGAGAGSGNASGGGGGGASVCCYYALLGIRKNASATDIRTAYRRLAMVSSPPRACMRAGVWLGALCFLDPRADLLTRSVRLPRARRSGTRTGGRATPPPPARPSGGSSGSRRPIPVRPTRLLRPPRLGCTGFDRIVRLAQSCRTRGRRPCTTPGFSIPWMTTTR